MQALLLQEKTNAKAVTLPSQLKQLNQLSQTLKSLPTLDKPSAIASSIKPEMLTKLFNDHHAAIEKVSSDKNDVLNKKVTENIKLSSTLNNKNVVHTKVDRYQSIQQRQAIKPPLPITPAIANAAQQQEIQKNMDREYS